MYTFLAFSISGESHGLGAVVTLLVIGALVFLVLGILVSPAFLAAGFARKQAEIIRNKRVSTVIPQYDPPRGLSPAEIGLLYDMHVGQAEIMATMFQLEARSIVKIVSENKVEVVDREAFDGLKEYEKQAVRICNVDMARQVSKIVPITIIDNETGATKTFNLQLPTRATMRAFKTAIILELHKKGITTRDYNAAFTVRALLLTCLFWLLPIATAGLGITDNGVKYAPWSWHAFTSAFSFCFLFGFFLWPVYVGAAVVFVFMWTRVAGQYWLNSKQARAVWPELEGYKLFLEQTDLDTIQFEATQNGPVSVNSLLPYAMVFGLDTKWQQLLAHRIAK